MSWQVKMNVSIKSLDIFKEVCLEEGVEFNETTLKLNKDGRYLGKLEDEKKDGMPTGVLTLVTDSDFTKSNRTQNMNTLMRNYSEKVCYRRIGSTGGTIMEREEMQDGSIQLRVAVGY